MTSAYLRAGYTQRSDYQKDLEIVTDTLEELEDHFGLEVKEVKVNPASDWCRAMLLEQKIKVGMNLIRRWSEIGYAEYKTLQYLIGLKWKRGERFRRYHKTLIGDKTIQAIMCHEYAHLLSFSRWGYHGDNHQIMYQSTVAEVYDFMFGPEFGATDRFLDKKGEKWLMEVKCIEAVRSTFL